MPDTYDTKKDQKILKKSGHRADCYKSQIIDYEKHLLKPNRMTKWNTYAT
ncbi:hypothetical protein HVE01_37070 [Vreelandella venusta]|nr:hypothetical protein HVE01_37070 [Halomonas venusta]